MPSPRQPFQSRRRLRHIRRLAALRGRKVTLPTKRASRLWALASIVGLLLLVLTLFVGRRYTAQKLDVEANIRAQLIPALEKELGRDIEIGKIESDYLSRIVLHDVVIGRDKTSPLGALLKAKRVTILLDAVSLVMRRSNPTQAISRIALESPELFIERNAAGQLNIANLLRRSAGDGNLWNGSVYVNNGRFYYRDYSLRSASGQTVLLDAQKLKGNVQFNGAQPVRYSLSIPEAYAGTQRVLVRDLNFIGTAAPNGRWIAFDVQFPYAPAALLADWAFRKRELVATAGTLGGRARLMWDAALPKAQQITATGVLTARNIDGYATQFNEPGTNRPLLLQDVDGIVRFADRSLESGALSLTAMGTPLRLAGKFVVAPLSFDVRVASTAFNTGRLMAALRASNAAPMLRNAQVNLSAARGELRLTGDLRNWTARGRLALDRAALAQSPWGTGAVSNPVAQFVVHSAVGATQAQAEFSAARANYTSREVGAWQAGGNLRGSAQWSGTATSASANQLQVRLAADSMSGQNAQLGTWRIGGASTLVRWNESQTGIELRATKLAGRHPQLGTLGARDLSATSTLAAQPGDGISVQLTAASAVGSGTAIPSLRGLNWQSGALSSTINWRAGRSRVLLNASTLRARQSQFGAARFGALRAYAEVDLARGATDFSARWNASNANLQNPQAGNWRAAGLLGVARGRSTRGATRIQADVEARRFAGSQPRYGNWSGNALRVSASTANAARGGWGGVAAIGGADVSQVNLAALSPELARSVRSTGTVSAKARFTDLGSAAPTVKGRAQLSQLILRNNGQDFALRDIETQIAFGGQQLRLAGLRANSQFGPLQADAQTGLSGGAIRLSLVAPRVELSAATLNPYLAASGVRLTGTARGRLRVTTTGAANQQYRASFDFALPSTHIFAKQIGNSQAPVRVAGARLRGDGNLQVASSTNWKFSGEAVLNANHLASGAPAQNGVPVAVAQPRAADVQLVARGTVARSAAGFTPNLRGELRAASVLVPLAPTETFALQKARADFRVLPRAIEISRFEAGAGEGSRVLGHATLRQNANERFDVAGQLLAERFDAARAQELMQRLQRNVRSSTEMPQIAGVLFARADFNGALESGNFSLGEIGVEARMYRGRVVYRENLIPVDAARLTTTLQFPVRATIPLEEFVIWSRGARLGARGTITPQDDTLALDISANLNTLRLEHLSNISALRPALESAQATGEINGLLSGQFRLTGTVAEPRVAGRTALRLAQVFGLDIESAAGNVLLETSDTGDATRMPDFRLAVSDISGVAEGSKFSGSLLADSSDNAWNLTLQTDQDVATNRLLRVAEARDDVRLRGWRDLPLRGDLAANLTVSGTLKDEEGNPRFAMGAGDINLETGTLRWRGRELGELTADLRLQNGALQARRFELTRPGVDGKDGALLRVAGVLPVALDSPNLDAQVTIENERLSFVLEVLEEIRQSLAERGQNVAYLDAVLSRLQGLPSTVEGRFDMRAQLEQSWRVPVVEVRSLEAREVFFTQPGGQRLQLPNVSARFIYDGNDNGAVAIQSAELRLPAKSAAAAATGDNDDTDPSDGDDDEDLLIRTLQPGRIVPGGDISLTTEILNADLQQLAQWIPALRNADGDSAIKGRLSDFVLRLTGTMSQPTITGSLQGENWQYNQYSLDRVRLDQFTIANGRLQVEPGYLTVVKGDFQSAAAWGYLPWNWGDETGETGISFTRPLELHLPVARENFGALAGIFVPQIINVGAQSFNGEVVIGGTLNAPQLSGEVQIEDGRFRLRSTLAELDAGVQNLNGTVRFADGNRLEVVGTGLTGKLVPADDIQAPTTGNEGTPARQQRDRQRQQKNPPPRISGSFNLQGNLALDLDRELWQAPRLAVAAQRYDLRLQLANASYATANFSGVRDVQMIAAFRSGEGPARENQNLQWALSASSNTQKNASGRILSFASLTMPPDFAVNTDAFLRAQVEPFSASSEFASWANLDQATAFRTAMLEAEGKPSRLKVDNFRFEWNRVARGIIDGTLLLDNQPAAEPAAPPFSAPRRRSRVQAASWSINRGNSNSGPSTLIPVQAGPGGGAPRRAAANQPQTRDPLRIAGRLTLEDAELYGAPETSSREEGNENASTAARPGGPGLLARLPAAPAFDVKLVAGRNVQFISSNLRATLTGNIDVGGTPSDPVVFGTLFTRSGSITFPNARARLESGEITVAARRDPATDTLRTRIEIDATARGRTGRYEITLRVRGPLDTGEGSTQDLRVDISSNPALSTDEAFAQLLGTASLNRGNISGGQDEAYARALVGFLSGPLFSGLERTLERTLGLDSIALDYRVDEPIGIEIGKAIGDRLYISYRRALSGSSGERTPFNLRIDYRLKGDLQLGLETDETETRRVTLRKSWRF